LRKDQFV